ncbi:MAG TPA: hypothetical protein V6D30_05350 [Leptolyngbyaceae cyanobacterium]
MQKIKVLTGITFALLLGAVSMSPVMAQTASPEQRVEDNDLTAPGGRSPSQNMQQQGVDDNSDMTSPSQTNQQPMTGGNQQMTSPSGTNQQPMTGGNQQMTSPSGTNQQQRTVETQEMRSRQQTTQQRTNVQTQPSSSQQNQQNTNPMPSDSIQENAPVRALW